MQLLLSCISTRHSTLKQHWSQTGQDTSCPLTVLGSVQKPKEDLGGQLCLLDDRAGVLKTLPLPLAAGLTPSQEGFLVTTFSTIHEVDAGLQHLQEDVITSPLFNALHSISRTRAGYLVASTGLDLLLEFDHAGNVLWNWWATDHGFSHTPTGEYRQLDKQADHRPIKYGTLQQTTHVNSVAELPDGRVLATLFHQGAVIAIDRDSGKWQYILEGLDHPHSVRILDEQHFTVADTVNGRALLARITADGSGTRIEETIDASTNWLQDASYSGRHDAWILVDGKQSQIKIRGGRSGEGQQTQLAVDPEWRLYEAYSLD